MKNTDKEIKVILDELYLKYNRSNFIENDPISIPHLFSNKNDIEIIAFLISILAWGQRKSIINSGKKLIEIFDKHPFQFITQHQDADLKSCLGFVHRTFNDTDLLSIIGFLKEIYQTSNSLETAFSKHILPKDANIENGLNGFRKDFENSLSFINRTKKHIAHPLSGSACKRLSMFLRWMVRKDEKGVDFGIWTSIKPSQLICPLDVHVIRQSIKLGLLKTDKANWIQAVDLTNKLKKFDKNDPVKYDFALFGLGVGEKYNEISY